MHMMDSELAEHEKSSVNPKGRHMVNCNVCNKVNSTMNYQNDGLMPGLFVKTPMVRT